jgi:hypothetical protein
MSSDTIHTSTTENTLQRDLEAPSNDQVSQVGMKDHKEYFWDVIRFKVYTFHNYYEGFSYSKTSTGWKHAISAPFVPIHRRITALRC